MIDQQGRQTNMFRNSFKLDISEILPDHIAYGPRISARGKITMRAKRKRRKNTQTQKAKLKIRTNRQTQRAKPKIRTNTQTQRAKPKKDKKDKKNKN